LKLLIICPWVDDDTRPNKTRMKSKELRDLLQRTVVPAFTCYDNPTN